MLSFLPSTFTLYVSNTLCSLISVLNMFLLSWCKSIHKIEKCMIFLVSEMINKLHQWIDFMFNEWFYSIFLYFSFPLPFTFRFLCLQSNFFTVFMFMSQDLVHIITSYPSEFYQVNRFFPIDNDLHIVSNWLTIEPTKIDRYWE